MSKYTVHKGLSNMALMSEKNLAKSLVGLAFLCMGGMLLNILREFNTKTSRPIAFIYADPIDYQLRNTGNIVVTQNDTAGIEKSLSKSPIVKISSQDVNQDKIKPDVVSPGGVDRKLNTAQHSPQENTNAVGGQKAAGQLSPCNASGEKLVGRLRVDQTVPNMEDIEKSWNGEKGGAWRPISCEAVSKVAIIIPYRDRYPHLKVFLRHMHPILQRQLLDYRIIVVEQNGNTPFNRAMMFNIGYKESLKFHSFQCFVFHDVDLLPEDDRNYYGCPQKPRHLSVAVDKFLYRLPYASIFGGVGAFTKEQFEKINGFSNKFWGWGGEDDDLYKRIRTVNYTLSRPMMSIGRYTMLKIGHKSAAKDASRHEKLKNSAKRMRVDGLNSLKYGVVKTEEHKLYTQVTVNVDPNAV